MDWETEEIEEVKEKKDFSKLVWGSIFLASLLMIGYLFTNDRTETKKQSGALVRHILIGYETGVPESRKQALSQVDNILEQLENGASFAEMAAKYSTDPSSKVKGGDLGWIKKGEMVDNFDTYAFNGPVGEYSKAVETGFGFHIIYIVERNLSDAELYQQDINRRMNELNKKSQQ
jgi:parvulin-like peptidyl-prolyl isomerase